jgi:ABC-2 type transport system permease protein
MIALYLKEIRSFLSSLIGYVVMGVFLLLVGLFMWVFPQDFNVLDSGFANVNPLFELAPWVFMFLIPAITMRSFAEEKRTGTIEMLLTKPLSDMNIVLAKYFAGLTLVIIALLPTLVYYISVYFMGNPVGNIDSGGAMGSYIGLIFLGGAYVAIGVFASSITSNQIIAFLLGAMLCFFFFIGFESIGSFKLFGDLDTYILALGIYDHNVNLAKGVIDTRDVAYFLALIALFLLVTRLVLQSRKW